MHSMKYKSQCFSLKDIKHISISGAEVFFADASEVDVDLYGDMLSDYRKIKISKIKKESAKKLSAGAELLLVYALHKLGYDENLSYTPDENGKLCFTDVKDLHFNLSHSGSMVACALSATEIGIDIEEERETKEAIAEKYFNENEKRKISGGFLTFTQVWVRKEAVAKADGRGIGMGLGTIDVSGDTLTVNGEEYRLYNIDALNDNYRLSVALKQKK